MGRDRSSSQGDFHCRTTVLGGGSGSNAVPCQGRVQVAGGSEFKAVREAERKRLNIPLNVLPPRSPKLNGFVERAHKKQLEEFYEITPECPWNVDTLNQRLQE
jgi:hypothetical protein